MSNEDSLPSWWTDKVTLAKDYIEKSSNYISNPAESVNEAERKMSSLEMQQIILLAKAMREMPGSPAQKKIKKQINVIRKKLGQAPVKESVNEVSGVDVAKKVLKNKQHEKGIDLQTANLIVTIDKAYDKNPRLQKKFRAIKLPKMKQLILKFGR